jgi:hypothetical protein
MPTTLLPPRQEWRIAPENFFEMSSFLLLYQQEIMSKWQVRDKVVAVSLHKRAESSKLAYVVATRHFCRDLSKSTSDDRRTPSVPFRVDALEQHTIFYKTVYKTCSRRPGNQRGFSKNGAKRMHQLALSLIHHHHRLIAPTIASWQAKST